MTKDDLISAAAELCNCSKEAARDITAAIIDTITNELAKGGTVELRGFGTFSRTERKAGKGRNPRTGEAIDIPARKLPHFKPGKGFRDTVAAI